MVSASTFASAILLSQSNASCQSWLCPQALIAALIANGVRSYFASTILHCKPNASCHSCLFSHALIAAL